MEGGCLSRCDLMERRADLTAPSVARTPVEDRVVRKEYAQ